jgi:hypothetical protein
VKTLQAISSPQSLSVSPLGPSNSRIMQERQDTNRTKHAKVLAGIICAHPFVDKHLVSAFAPRHRRGEGAARVRLARPQRYKVSSRDCDRWLVCILAALFGLAGTFISVWLHGQPATVFYVLLGFCGAMPAIVLQTKLRPRLG